MPQALSINTDASRLSSAWAIVQMMGLAKPNPQPPSRVATYRVSTDVDFATHLTEATFRVRCNRQPDAER